MHLHFKAPFAPKDKFQMHFDRCCYRFLYNFLFRFQLYGNVVMIAIYHGIFCLLIKRVNI